MCIIKNISAQKNGAENTFLLNEITNKIDNYYILNPTEKFHCSFKPYLYLTLKEANDSAFNYSSFSIDHHRFLQKTIREKPNYRNRVEMQLLPVLDMQAGYDFFRNKFLSETSGGIYIRTDINNDFSAAITLQGGKINFPDFTDSIVQITKIIPGMGIAHGKNNEYQWTNFVGYASYTPHRLFNFQIGKDKHFIGDGYRSLLLSDVSNSYPYARMSLNVWKIQYSVWYSLFKDVGLGNGIKNNFKNKYGAFHYLSWNINKYINLSFFESVVWQGTDSNRVRNFDVNYLNPITFYRPVEYSLGSADNELMGINFNCRMFKKLKFYTQFVLDEFYLKEIKLSRGWWANKQGIQAGLKYINAFNVKNLFFQCEFNAVRPYTYSHGSIQQNYSHFNQPLAHPFGANFYEGVAILSYKRKNISLDIKCVYATLGKDTINTKSNMGQNIFSSYTTRPYDYGHYIAQGVKTQFLQTDVKLSFYIVPEMNLRLELGYIQTNITNELTFNRRTPFIYVGIRSSFHNFYRDL